MINFSLKIALQTDDTRIHALFADLAAQITDFNIVDDAPDIYVFDHHSAQNEANHDKPAVQLIFKSDETEDNNAPYPILYLPQKPSVLLNALYDISQKSSFSPLHTIAVETELFLLDPIEQSFINKRNHAKTILTDKEYELLYTLSQAEGFWLSKDDLLERIWGYAQDIDTHTLETHIYRLRRKIEKTPSKPEIFVNENQGYKLNITA